MPINHLSKFLVAMVITFATLMVILIWIIVIKLLPLIIP